MGRGNRAANGKGGDVPKLLIPYYAIDEQAYTATATATAPAAIVDTYELRCALDCDMQNYFWWANSAGVTDADQPIVHHYTALSTMATEIAAKFGTSACWANYIKIGTGAYVGSSTADYNYLLLYSSANGVTYTLRDTFVYGEGTNAVNLVYLTPGSFAKQINDGDGDLVIYDSTSDGIFAYHKIELWNDDPLQYGNFKLYHLIDGLLVTLPFTPDSREWSEQHEGGDLSYGPSGKVHHVGLKNVHMHRGKRRFTTLFPEIGATARINPARKYSDQVTWVDSDVNKLMECFKAGKGVIPMLYMHDETDTGTWSVCRFIGLRLSEPSAGYWTAEATFEEY